MPPHVDDGQPRLAADRVFSLPGIGTVVTGTLTGGSLKQGKTIKAFPPGANSRIRSVQSHHRGQNDGVGGSIVKRPAQGPHAGGPLVYGCPTEASSLQATHLSEVRTSAVTFSRGWRK